MNKKYQQPKLTVFQFDTEDAVMLSTSATGLDTNGNDYQRTQDMYLWSNESLW